MDLLFYVYLAVLQGITEPLPISSSGHLIIFQSIFNFDSPGLYLEVILNFASMIAVIVFFYSDLKELIISFYKYIFFSSKRKLKNINNDFTYILKLIVATIPLGIVGIFITLFITFEFEENITIVGIALIITAILLLIAGNKSGKKNDEEISYLDALIIGLFQVVAFLPGISRSATTIVGGYVVGLKPSVAFKFSFMLYIPISIGSFIVTLLVIFLNDINNINVIYLGIIMLVCSIFTFISLKLFKHLVTKGKLYYFSIYCFILGTLVIIFL